MTSILIKKRESEREKPRLVTREADICVMSHLLGEEMPGRPQRVREAEGLWFPDKQSCTQLIEPRENKVLWFGGGFGGWGKDS